MSGVTIASVPGGLMRRALTSARQGNRVLVAVTLAVLAVLIFLPTALVFIGAVADNPRQPFSTLTAHALAESYGSPHIWLVLGQTILMAVSCAVLATAAGGALAWLLTRTDLPLRRAFEFIVIAPLFLSPFIGALAWMELGAPRTGLLNQVARELGLPSWVHINVMTFTGLIIILALHYVPYGYLLISSSLQNMDGSLEEASYVNGRGTIQTVLRITTPAVRPAMLSAVMFVTISATGMFSVPALLGARMSFEPLAVSVYHATVGYPSDYALAAALGTMLVLISVVGLLMYQRSLRQAARFVTVTGRSQQRRTALGLGIYPVLAILIVYGIVTTFLPYASLVISAFSRSTNLAQISFTTSIFARVLAKPEIAQAFGNTLVVSALTAVGCVAVGLLTSYVTERMRHKGSGLVNSLAMSPLAIPGIVFATGVFTMYLGSFIYGTLTIMIVAYVATYLPHATRVTGNGFAQIDKSLEEASRVCGASRWRMMRTVLVPLLRPSIAAAVIMVFLFTVREINTAVLLYTPDTILASILAFNYAQQASLSAAAGVGLLQTGLMIAWIGVAKLLLRPGGSLYQRS